MKKIANFGAFDHDSYGDLLFPVVTLFSLPADEFHLVNVSPSGVSTIWPDGVETISIVEALAVDDWDGIMISGGDIIQIAGGLSANWRSDISLVMGALTGIWVGASILSARLGVPLVWNAPGVPFEFSPKYVDLVKIVLDSADYISVRDELSKAILTLYTDKEVHVVPDTAVQISRFWPKKEVGGGGDYFVLSASKGDLEHCGHALSCVAEELKGRAGSKSLVLPLMAWQLKFYEGYGSEFSGISDFVSVCPRSFGLEESAKVIAGARGYVGNSLHGYITAISYGVPAILVRPYGAGFIHKYDGVVRSFGLGADLNIAESWSGALSLFDGLCSFDNMGSINRLCDDHWRMVVDVFNKKPSPKEHVLARLGQLLLIKSKGSIEFGITPDLLLGSIATSEVLVCKGSSDFCSRNSELESDVRDLKRICFERYNFISSLQDQLVVQRDAIESLRSSNSWRLTAPFRFLSLYMRTIFRRVRLLIK